MKKLIFPALITGIFAVSCSKKETTKLLNNSEIGSTTTTEKASPNGIFEGTLPCADCPGIETKLTLNDSNKTYILDSKYLEKENRTFSDRGSFDVNEDGKFITLKEKGNSPTSQVYYITDSSAYLVGKIGDTILKNEYKLNRKIR